MKFTCSVAEVNNNVNVKELEQEYKIRNKSMFICVVTVVSLVVFGFFIENFLSAWIHISMAWIAELGALAILLIADVKELDHVLEKVEWSTLLFFATLFIMMEGLGILGIIDTLGSIVISIIEIPGSPLLRLIFAITLILWLSSFMSAFIDSIPYTTAMVRPVRFLLLLCCRRSFPVHLLLFSTDRFRWSSR